MTTINDVEIISTLTLSDFVADGVIGTASATVDKVSSINIPQTTANISLTVTNPTDSTAGRALTIYNTGAVDFTINGEKLSPARHIEFIWNGTLWSIEMDDDLVTTREDFAPATAGSTTTLANPVNSAIIVRDGLTQISGADYTLSAGVITWVTPLNGNENVIAIYDINAPVTPPTSSLKYYAENVAPPTVSPTATGLGAIAIGDGAEASQESVLAFGTNAGSTTTGADFSNFIGSQAGLGANDALFANFIGLQAGLDATNSIDSVFIGRVAGAGAANADHSVFIGQGTGESAPNASSSIFIGRSTGGQTTGANNSIFLGTNSGFNDAVNNISGGTSILIGNNTNTGGFSNSIAIGDGAINTASNQFLIGGTTLYDIVNPNYPSTRNDSTSLTPSNYLFTDSTGKFLLAQKVIMSARQESNQTIPFGTFTLLTNYTSDIDTSSAFDPITGIFTVPDDGIYAITANITYDASSDLSSPGKVVRGIIGNDTLSVVHAYQTDFIEPFSGGLAVSYLTMSTTVMGITGDKIALWTLYEGSSNISTRSSSVNCKLSINKL